jgi:hypothetical protein
MELKFIRSGIAPLGCMVETVLMPSPTDDRFMNG